MIFRAKPFQPKLGKAVRKALVRQLRELLAQRPMTMAELSDAAQVEPEALVVGLRELRGRKRGVLRSSIRFGHVAWRWEDTPATPRAPTIATDGEAAPAKDPKKKKARKKKRWREPESAGGAAAAKRKKKKAKDAGKEGGNADVVASDGAAGDDASAAGRSPDSPSDRNTDGVS